MYTATVGGALLLPFPLFLLSTVYLDNVWN